jgi:hypothetical protein
MANEQILREIRRLLELPRGDDKREQRERENLLADNKEAAANAFAELNGWERLSGNRYSFSPGDLGKSLAAASRDDGRFPGLSSNFFDHPLYFVRRVPEKRVRICAAVVAQPYARNVHDDVELLRERFDVHMAPMPYASIHYPGSTLFIVVAERGRAAVRWLPEQLSSSEFAAKPGD